MILSLPTRCAPLAALAAIIVTWSGPQLALAQAPAGVSHVSASGSFLAAQHASRDRDAAAAATFYRSALRSDPKNNELLDRTFLSVLLNGDVEEAVRLADRVLAVDKEDRIARLVLGVRAIKQKQYQVARQQFAQSVRGPITDLAAVLLSAWTQDTAADSKAAVDAIDKLTGPDWYGIFKELHAGMILDAAGQKAAAGKRLEHAYQLDATALRVVQAYGSYQSRNGSKDDALKTFKAFEEVLPHHPLIADAMADLNAGKKLPILVDSPQAGAAEVLYGLGAALGRRGGEDLGLIYLQLSLYLVPSHQLALLSLADLYEGLKKPELAIKTYERMPPNSPLERSALIQRAIDLDGSDRSDEAKADLEKLITASPTDLEAIMALGNLLRGRKQFAECADVYSKGLATMPAPDKSAWTLYYFRGICFERSKQWPKGEADLKKALELFPDQPHVLNYLGYSWVDKGMNLDEGMAMIKRAVEQRADDGYIVDSLGWAYFRIGKYEEAVKELDRAVELKPEDPTINDHLGDAYWKVGRTVEARFQWAHARDLGPEAEDLPAIEAKLKSGLPDASAVDAGKAKKPEGGG
ncbi:MAG TPA: tetratricopeptide repeat protein [Stellaceae bacterium]|nr:tetratricopeptide repeat protein [Stellaceae bacterium]